MGVKSEAKKMAEKAEQACLAYVKSRLSWSWPGSTRVVRGELQARATEAIEAEQATTSTRVWPWEEVAALRAVRNAKGMVDAWWHGTTVPWTEKGVRLLKKEAVGEFIAEVDRAKASLESLGAAVQAARPEIIALARKRRGRAFQEGDYPSDLARMFGVSQDIYPLTVPKELREISETAFQAQSARNQMMVLGAIQVAEEGFLSELERMTGNLLEKLTNFGKKDPETGKPKVALRDAALENLKEFCQQFSQTVCWGCDELEEVISETAEALNGLTAEDLRRSMTIRRRVATVLSGIVEEVSKQKGEVGGQET